ncbi:hypothetical protein BDM02DRAFT_3193793 [Thelephora ganbajun]|uniref:Uncharacterized protein n=1 Tax=Thelephora ganbajun TaxID=370292 RepID=A0ACB6YYL0_THEGA|nr:hypothetical protein BDM02DRAFT_3193793 [Thelephora ganbajun]
MIFPPSSKAGSTKTLTFKKKDDFSIRLSYSLFSGADSESTILTDESTTSEDMPRLLGLELVIPSMIDFEFGSTPMTGKEKRAARKRLCEINSIEGSKHRKEEARNNLESYLYKLCKLRDLLGGASRPLFRRYSQSGANVC